ncbi:MAG: hypothetical protein KC766_27785 [Myxococcales bacterium]|nr:hypothetical protein [Myxococcales bacterium]
MAPSLHSIVARVFGSVALAPSRRNRAQFADHPAASWSRLGVAGGHGARFGAGIVLALGLHAGSAAAQHSAAVQQSAAKTDYSELERYTIQRELDSLKSAGKPAAREPRPDGKRIESVRIVTLEVFDEQDPVPDFVNEFHTTSREHVIRRELLFRVGDTYRAETIEETERNLRALRQLSVVLIVPLKGSKPDRVRLLVITRDVWSLRLNWNARLQAGKLEQLLVQPSEENLFGTHRTVSALFALQLDRYIAGATYINPRVGDSRIQAAAIANVIFNRESGEAEGSYGGFSYGQPLYSTHTKWAWGTTVVWRREIVRRFVGGELASLDTGFGDVRYQYRSDQLAGEYSITRSFGRENKLDLTLGAEALRSAYGIVDAQDYDPRARRIFLDEEVPQSDTRLSPFVGLEAYSNRYLRTLNFETLGLQEDLQLGHRALLKLYPASRAVGSSRDLLGVHSVLGYTWPLGDGLFRLLGSSRIEASRLDQSDAEVAGALRVATPRFGAGRLVYDGVISNRFQDYLNLRYQLGGNTRPRGYPSFAFIGKDRIASSLEFRSRSVQLFGAELGSVLFYDVGDAFNGFDRVDLNHAVGFGLRGLFPMFDRIVFRFDWGFPLGNERYATFPGNFVVTFKQAFPLPVPASSSVTTGLSSTDE